MLGLARDVTIEVICNQYDLEKGKAERTEQEVVFVRHIHQFEGGLTGQLIIAEECRFHFLYCQKVIIQPFGIYILFG